MTVENQGPYAEIARFAYRVRRDIVTMLTQAGSGHLGGSLSGVEILATLYRGGILQVSPQRITDPGRDRFVLSNGHVAPLLYAVLARMGYFPVEESSTLRHLGSRLQGHPSLLHGLPGLESSSGSLGQGLSVGVGFALAGRLQGYDYHTFTLLGDGELQEGQIWEAAMSASHHQLGNLTAIVDYNGLQIGGETRSVMNLEPLSDKFESFGWRVSVVDGHNVQALHATLTGARGSEGDGVPCLILAKTVMGQGIPSIMGKYSWHGRVPNAEECARFLRELEAFYPELATQELDCVK